MILFPENLILEDDRVLMKPLEVSDFERLLPFAENEADLWTYSAVSSAGREGMRVYIEHAIRERILKKEYAFIIFDKKYNSFAGSTRFYDVQLNYGTTQLGYTWYGKQFQRTGLNRHCKFLMLQYAFEIWAIERVEFRADLRNEKSIAAMKNIGCTVEGVLRSNMTSQTGRRDSIVLSILKKEWFESVKESLRAKTY
jgi:N-acetyltransferase